MATQIITYDLELTDPAAFRPAPVRGGDLEIRQVELPCPEFNRFFYTAVGGHLYWLNRLPWTYAQWRAYLDRPELQTWAAYLSGTPAGYFELEMQPKASVEIVYFGLLPGFTGRGFGGRLLTAAVQRAWQWGARRVWLHTCTLDHPAALPNYLARGFRLLGETTKVEELPARPPGPWPGAVE